jgi:APA family basic amino acid/polyamine antiporter
VPEHFGMLHSKTLTPHRSIWTLATIAAVLGCLGLAVLFGNAGALSDATIKALPQGFWSSFGYMSHDTMAALPNSLLTVELSSNFGTFLLYALSCVVCLVAYHNHPNFNFIKHMAIPVFGLLANLTCMAFYVVGPFMGYGTKIEPLVALGVAAVWGIYGGIYFIRSSKSKKRTTLVNKRFMAAQ